MTEATRVSVKTLMDGAEHHVTRDEYKGITEHFVGTLVRRAVKADVDLSVEVSRAGNVKVRFWPQVDAGYNTVDGPTVEDVEATA